MSSENRVRANRANAKRSTGPRTAAGRARSSQNALRHGLASAAYVEDRAAVSELARLIAGTAAGDAEVMHLAERVAEARLHLERVRAVRVNAQSHWVKIFVTEEGAILPAFSASFQRTYTALLTTGLENLDRYECRARSSLKTAVRRFDDVVVARRVT
jgi:hypothetical protein